MPQRPATGSGKERRFPSRFFPCEKAVTEDTRQRCKGAGHDYPDMRHAACCSGAQPVRMKARMGIGKPPVTPGTIPRTGTKTGRRKKRGKKEEEREGPPDGRCPRAAAANARPAKAHNEKRLATFAASLWIPWCRGTELNCRHGDFQSPALPTELPRREVVLFVTTKMLVQISLRLGKHFFSFYAFQRAK